MFRLDWGALLELRKLFTLDEMTDSRLELMMLFLFSSGKHQKTKSCQTEAARLLPITPSLT